MPRNLDRRVELMVPVEDSACAERLDEILKTGLADTQQAWRLLANGTYERRQPDSRHPALRSQEAFQRRAEARAAAAQQQIPVLEPQRPAEQKKQG